jgi:hypothetical protein
LAISSVIKHLYLEHGARRLDSASQVVAESGLQRKGEWRENCVVEDIFMETAIRPGKDTYVFQKARVTRICNELAPGKLVEFDEGNSWIKFRVRDDVLGVNLTEPSGEWIPSQLADKSDDWLRTFVKKLSNGKIR